MHTASDFQTRHDACAVLGTHRHGPAYAALVLDGNHVETSADGPVECPPGTLLLHPRWHAHGNRFGRHGARVLNLELDARLAPARLQAMRIEDIGEAIAVLARAPHRLAELVASAHAIDAPTLHAWQVPFLHELEHGDDDVSTLARRAGVSLAHASRSFQRSHGLSPQLLRRELRSRQALALLAGPLPLADIAAMSGFADQAHLGRTLRAATGATPTQLRRQIKCVQDAA